jgi:hypothetical protein
VPVDYAALLKKLPPPKAAAPDAAKPRLERKWGNGPVIGPWGDGAADGELRYVSPSQLERFDPESEGGCMRKWWFRYRLRLPDKKTKAKDLGTQVHAQLEHYLKTGDDVLGDLAAAGRRFVPSPGSDLLVESEYGVPAWPGPVDAPVSSPVRAAGVPIVMKIDLMHARGTFLDDSGALVADPPRTVEVRDWKTTKQIDDLYDDDGNLVQRGYAKRAEDLIKTWQMPAYGALALATGGPWSYVRLSHGYFQTYKSRAAALRSSLHAADEIRARWDAPAERLVEKMKAVARATRVEDVPANAPRACQAFGGCPYQNQCPRDKKAVLAAMLGKNKERTAMSLKALLKNKNAAPAAPATKPAASEVETEKAKLLAEERAVKRGGGIEPPDKPAPDKIAEPHPTMLIKVEAECGHTVPLEQTSKLPNGVVKHIGCDKKVEAEAPKPAPEAKAEPAKPAPGDDCPVGGTQQKMDASAKKYECACGATLKVKKPSKMPDGAHYSIVPAHEVPGDIAGPPAEEKPVVAEPAKVEKVVEKVAAAAAPTDDHYHYWKPVAGVDCQRKTVDLYLDAVEDGVATQRLEAYAEKLCADLAEQYGAADVRCAPSDSPLAFGKYKGALAAVVRAQPPAPGAYVVSGASELGMIAFETLSSMKLGRVVRGAK